MNTAATLTALLALVDNPELAPNIATTAFVAGVRELQVSLVRQDASAVQRVDSPARYVGQEPVQERNLKLHLIDLLNDPDVQRALARVTR